MSGQVYNFEGREYTQKPLLTGAFENALIILEDVGFDDLWASWSAVQQVFDENKGGRVKVDMDAVAESTIKSLSAIGKVHAISKLMESLLNLTPEEGLLVPMAVARSAITDFFILNSDWLPISPRFSTLMIALKKMSSLKSSKCSVRQRMISRVRKILSWGSMQKSPRTSPV